MTVTENQTGGRRADGDVDARVLGQLLHAMPVLAMLPTAERIAEFLTAALSDIPGVRSCAVHLGEASAQGNVPSRPGLLTIPVETSGEVYGGFVLETDDESALAPYLPFLTNLAGSVALLAENRLQRDRLEAALADVRESEERYRSLFENLTEGVALHELLLDERAAPIDYRILAVNPAFTAQTGLSAEAVCGKLASEAYGSGQAPFLEQYAAVTLSGEPVRFQEHFAPLGRDFDITAVRQSEGHFASLFEDVTEQRRAEAEILRLNTELEQRVVSRTEQRDAATRELESFAYSVAHDVRAPLRAIDGFSAMVLADDGDHLSPESVAHLQRAGAAAQRMTRLLEDVLGLSRVSSRDLLRQPVDLSRLAAEVAEELRAEQPQRVVELVVEPGLNADADLALTRLILRELLANAWKFTGQHEAAHVEFGATDEGGERAFYVRDDGAGFDMRYAEQLFGAFRRLHTAGQFDGDGIGLATVQRVVRRHGGRVWAEGEVEKGATFSFTLPGATATA